ncbi:hypothetical protein RDI58_017693 [Solanum bulbocastanum]|uniref:Uncharacterized protein n=1 Tax=Solanum bulbocastanum TaxID=147425 RepID=A0AAN8Y934_SOLBU
MRHKVFRDLMDKRSCTSCYFSGTLFKKLEDLQGGVFILGLVELFMQLFKRPGEVILIKAPRTWVRLLRVAVRGFKVMVKEDMMLAYSLRRHGLEIWEMVVAKFSNSISDRSQCILQFSSVGCQVKYASLKERFKSLYQKDFTKEEDDESGFIKLMADKLTKTYRDYWTEEVKVMDTPLQYDISFT